MIIAIGKSRRDTKWRNVDMTWSELVAKLRTPFRTHETVREYKAMSRDDQGKAKDIGGFVGGQIDGGRRTKAAVSSRTLVTLDADHATPDTLDDALLTWEGAMVVYSTHSHTPEKPRLRFVIPLKRAVTPDEYPAVARKLAARIGIDTMDLSTYEAERLMYWPSCPADGEYVFEEIDGEWIDPDKVLAEYGLGEAWKDTTLWPIASDEQEITVRSAKLAGDPAEKPGMVGLFCRTYGIEEAINEFLSDKYESVGNHRYTYLPGSTAAGAIEYDNKFLYSHHGTDPCGGQLVNSFDLVRIHKFGDRDIGQENQEINRRPSYSAMCDFASDLPAVKAQLVAEQTAGLADLVEEDTPEDSDDWQSELEVNSKGVIELSLKNLILIMEHDPNLKDTMAYNLLRGGPVMLRRAPWDSRTGDIPAGGEPWRDTDNAGLRWYMESVWHLVGKDKIQDALDLVRERHAFDPVRDYLTGLEWDGVERLDTMLVKWMGAEDNAYVRAVTRKWMCAAVARAMHPGCKFDHMLVLIGKQGIGKSNMARILSRGWFTDSLGRMDSSKDSYERLSGVWIAEIAELAAAKKTEVEDIKNFISKQEDTFRKAYGRENTTMKRHCVFYGSSNDQEIIRDRTGGRRFWPVEVKGFDHGWLKGFEDEVDQLWAEAVVRWRSGEPLTMTDEKLWDLAREVQEAHTAVDDWADEIQNYLDTLLPDNWADLDRLQRRAFFDWTYAASFSDLGSVGKNGTNLRTKVSGAEIRWECFGTKPGSANDMTARRIANVMNNMPGWKRLAKPYRDKTYGIVRGWERSDQ